MAHSSLEINISMAMSFEDGVELAETIRRLYKLVPKEHEYLANCLIDDCEHLMFDLLRVTDG